MSWWQQCPAAECLYVEALVELLILKCCIDFTTACLGVVIMSSVYSWMAYKCRPGCCSIGFDKSLIKTRIEAGCVLAFQIQIWYEKTDLVSHQGDCVVAVPGRCCRIFRSACWGLMCLQTRRKVMPSYTDVGRAALNSSCATGQVYKRLLVVVLPHPAAVGYYAL